MPDLAFAGYEALCSALWQMSFTRFLGERPDPDTGQPVAWFLMARDPENWRNARQDPLVVRVAVFRLDEALIEGIVGVRAEWLNLSGDEILKSEQTFHIATAALTTAEAGQATEDVVLRLLDIFSDVVNQTGVAGPIDQIAPASEAGDPDDEDDMAVPE